MAFLFDFFRRRRSSTANRELLLADEERLAGYTRYLKAYQGWTLREWLHSTNRDTFSAEAYKRLKFNFSRPVVNLGASFLAALPLDWEVRNDPDATKACYDIWGRSYSFFRAARTAAIYGDIVALATQNADGNPRIEFVSPDICFPTFDGKDFSTLTELDISYETVTRDGKRLVRREFYDKTGRTVYEGNEERLEERQTLDGIPAAWIPNLSITGNPFGESDIAPIADLVDEYDHCCQKQTRIIDYYAAPNIVFQGIQATDVAKTTMTTFFVPADGDVHFLEWQGNSPAVEPHLDRIRNAIAEVSQVPAVAFGQQDAGFTQLSGVAIRLLYGPLIQKNGDKQQSWEPGLKHVMRTCLRAAGHDAPYDDLNVVWPDNTPIGGAEKMAEETAAVASGLRSKRTAMNNLGIEQPDSELKRIFIERRLEQLLAPQAGTDAPIADPIKTAQAAAKGAMMAAARGPGNVDITAKTGAPGANGAVAALQPISALLAEFDAVIDAETANIDKNDPETKDE